MPHSPLPKPFATTGFAGSPKVSWTPDSSGHRGVIRQPTESRRPRSVEAGRPPSPEQPFRGRADGRDRCDLTRGGLLPRSQRRHAPPGSSQRQGVPRSEKVRSAFASRRNPVDSAVDNHQPRQFDLPTSRLRDAPGVVARPGVRSTGFTSGQSATAGVGRDLTHRGGSGCISPAAGRGRRGPRRPGTATSPGLSAPTGPDWGWDATPLDDGPSDATPSPGALSRRCRSSRPPAQSKEC